MSCDNYLWRSQVPAGIFLPTIAIGAALGRAVGLLTYGLISLPKINCFVLTMLSQGFIGRTPKRGCSPPVHQTQQSAASTLASTLLSAHHQYWQALTG